MEGFQPEEMDAEKLYCMKKISKVLALVLYYSLAKHLPNYSFPGGVFFNWFRIFLLRRIINVGNNCRIMRNIYIGNGNNISIGNHCRINENCRLDNVQIGNHVMIARESILLGKMHEFKEIDTPMQMQGNKQSDPIIIEDDVWIGLRVMVLPGLLIRQGTIIGAGAVLTKNTEPFGVYGGIPAKLIKFRNK
jgi:maltose O-acetyltransferase